MKLLAVCIGKPRLTPGRTSSRTGIFKEPVEGSVLVDTDGLVGDRIMNRKHHGGPDQAVYIEGGIDHAWWSQELGREIEPGTFGENLLISDLDNREIAVGDRFELGEVVLEVTSARIPCSTFSARMEDPKFVKRYSQAGRPGAYARVLTGGVLTAGAEVTHIPYQGNRITMPELLRTYGRKLEDAELERYRSAPISSRMRAAIQKR